MVQVAPHVKGVQSIELGTRLLAALAAARKPMSLTELAKAADMSRSKARRYLVSYLRTGFVEQDESGARYDLSAFAIHLGLSALDRRDLFRTAKKHMRALREKLQVVAALVIWTEFGPRVLHFEEGDTGVVRLMSQLGGTLSLARTAAGRVFVAWLPDSVTAPFLEREGDKVPPDFADILEEVRKQKLARLIGYPAKGICIMAAPIFEYGNQVVGSLVIMGAREHFDSGWSGVPAQELRAAAQQVSYAMGHACGEAA
jgi:DNA-binding IclR family transcriptional regulator